MIAVIFEVWVDPERLFLRFVSLSSSFPLQVNDELKLALRQSDYSVQLGLTGYRSPSRRFSAPYSLSHLATKDLALVLGWYPHDRRTDTRGLGLEVAAQRAVVAIAGMLLEVKTVQAYRPRIGQKLVGHVVDVELVPSLL